MSLVLVQMQWKKKEIALAVDCFRSEAEEWTRNVKYEAGRYSKFSNKRLSITPSRLADYDCTGLSDESPDAYTKLLNMMPVPYSLRLPHVCCESDTQAYCPFIRGNA